jgi:hypothetical protein
LQGYQASLHPLERQAKTQKLFSNFNYEQTRILSPISQKHKQESLLEVTEKKYRTIEHWTSSKQPCSCVTSSFLLFRLPTLVLGSAPSKHKSKSKKTN